MYKFNGIVPTYDDFKGFFVNCGLDFTNPNTEFFYVFMKNEFGNRYFRWEDLEEIKTLCALNLRNGFFVFEKILAIEKYNLEKLIAIATSNRVYQLPGSGSEITDENINKHLDGKQLTLTNNAILNIISQLGNIELFNNVRKHLAKCFNSFSF